MLYPNFLKITILLCCTCTCTYVHVCASQIDNNFEAYLEEWESNQCRILSWFINISVSSITSLLPCLGTGQAAWKYLDNCYNLQLHSCFRPGIPTWVIFFLVALCLLRLSQKWKSDFHTSCTCIAFLQDFMLLWWKLYGGYILFTFILQDIVLFYLNFMCRGKRPAIAANESSNVVS